MNMKNEGNNYTVYKLTSPSGKVYIGITSKTVQERWRNGKGYKDNAHISFAIEKYGWENFKKEILFENLSSEEAFKTEILKIKEFRCTDPNFGYNKSSGGESGYSGVKCSEETREKLRQYRGEKHHGFGKPISEQHKKRIGDANRGKKNSLESRKHMSDAHKGQHNSPESMKKCHDANKKKIVCIENGMIFESLQEAANFAGVSYTGISAVANGRAKKAGGFRWKYYGVKA